MEQTRFSPLPKTHAEARGQVLECADKAGADYLTTGNSRHFPKFWKKTNVIMAREFVSLAAPHLVPCRGAMTPEIGTTTHLGAGQGKL
jgi:hypothetical protein